MKNKIILGFIIISSYTISPSDITSPSPDSFIGAYDPSQLITEKNNTLYSYDELRPLEFLALYGLEEDRGISPFNTSFKEEEGEKTPNSNETAVYHQPSFPKTATKTTTKKMDPRLYKILFGDVTTAPQSRTNTPICAISRPASPTQAELLQEFLDEIFKGYQKEAEEIARHYEHSKDSMFRHTKRSLTPENQSSGKRQQNYNDASSLSKALMGEELSTLTPNKLNVLYHKIQMLKGMSHLIYTENKYTFYILENIIISKLK